MINLNEHIVVNDMMPQFLWTKQSFKLQRYKVHDT